MGLLLKENGEHIKKENPALYKSITGKALASETSKPEEVKEKMNDERKGC